MERHHQIDTPLGLAAYECYSEWLRMFRGSPASKQTFIDSKYYNSFINFVKFCRKMNIPDRMAFIKLAAGLKLSPSSWVSDDFYLYYIEHIDTILTPDQQASISVDTLFELTRIFECEMDEVFEHLSPADVLTMVQSRKLSPWILLVSKKFFEFMKHKTTQEQRILIQTVINPDAWKVKFQKNPKTVQKMKRYVEEMGL
jgi:hypothetical protein